MLNKSCFFVGGIFVVLRGVYMGVNIVCWFVFFLGIYLVLFISLINQYEITLITIVF